MNNIIVKCLGGLGNQMFQYTFYRRLQLDGNNVLLDISEFDSYDLHNGFELDNIFGLKIKFADISTTRQIKSRVSSVSKLTKIIWKMFDSGPIIIQKYFGFKQKYLYYKNKYLEGYWQSEKYFAKYADVIRNDFRFAEFDEVNKRYVGEIKLTNAVSLHVRMGDYVNHPLHGGICTPEYYKKAVEIINLNVSNPQFFIFSNDIEWCENNLKLENVVYVTGNIGEDSYRDMQLMSMCKHNIIANSSFSWWGAWLNSNPDKIIIAPSRWFNDTKINTKDLLPESWIQI